MKTGLTAHHRVRPSFVGTDELDAAKHAEWFELPFAVLRAVLF
jgi:hypothetical protein